MWYPRFLLNGIKKYFTSPRICQRAWRAMSHLLFFSYLFIIIFLFSDQLHLFEGYATHCQECAHNQKKKGGGDRKDSKVLWLRRRQAGCSSGLWCAESMITSVIGSAVPYTLQNTDALLSLKPVLNWANVSSRT